jgi:hypothetical protein
MAGLEVIEVVEAAEVVDGAVGAGVAETSSLGIGGNATNVTSCHSVPQIHISPRLLTHPAEAPVHIFTSTLATQLRVRRIQFREEDQVFPVLRDQAWHGEPPGPEQGQHRTGQNGVLRLDNREFAESLLPFRMDTRASPLNDKRLAPLPASSHPSGNTRMHTFIAHLHRAKWASLTRTSIHT